MLTASPTHPTPEAGVRTQSKYCAAKFLFIGKQKLLAIKIQSLHHCSKEDKMISNLLLGIGFMLLMLASALDPQTESAIWIHVSLLFFASFVMLSGVVLRR